MASCGRAFRFRSASAMTGLLLLLPCLAQADDPPPAASEPLTLPRLLDLAAQNSPDLAAARARADAARGRLIQAGLYPNPTVAVGVEELGNKEGPAGTAGVAIGQEIVTVGKLRLAQAAAASGVVATDWQATTRWFVVVTRVRQAYYEALTARREVESAGAAVKIAQDGLDAILKLAARGVKARPDVLRARVEVEQNRIRLVQAQKRSDAADKLLAAAVGVRALPPGPLQGSLDTSPPRYDYQPTLEAILVRSSEVQAAQALVQQAGQLLLHAQAERVPNVHVSVRPGYNDVDKTAQVNIEAGVALPLFNRNQGNIFAAQADFARAQADARAVELRLTERLATAFQRYAAARRQVESYDLHILPDAREALRLVRIGYESGDAKYDYTAVLEAQRTLVQAQLLAVQVRGEQWRAASDIAGLLEDDAGLPPRPVPTPPECLSH